MQITLSAPPAPSPAQDRDADPVTAPPTFDPDKWYRLTNICLGQKHSLDVINDGGASSTGTLQMARTGNFTGQYWKFQPIPSYTSAHDYALSTSFLGENKRLEVVAGDPRPSLRAPNAGSGQVWRVAVWPDGTYRLSCGQGGDGMHLDTYMYSWGQGRDGMHLNAYRPFMKDGEYSGQHWVIEPLHG